ncbi:reverse transcriptase domain-containing protein [Tanacetum coccineum]|uniref:Reverse transcriptase domain-containing protein n=1 Tax=Tanacetum coccineum TaxID=301880 RepID=A0ABQ5F9M7_9ASTR
MPYLSDLQRIQDRKKYRADLKCQFGYATRFPITLTEAAKRWVDKLSLGTVDSWDLLKKPLSKGCKLCGGAHLDKECPLNEEVKSVEEVKPSLEELMSKHLEESTRRRAEMEEWVKKLQENAKTATEVPNLSVGQCKAVYANDGALIDNKSSNETNEVSFIANNKAQEAQEEDDVPTKVLPCQLPLKELNPRSFTLPCTIRSLNFYVMADLGASVNVIPRSMFEHIKLSNLNKTAMLVEMDDMTKRAPIGIVENVLVGIKSLLEVTAYEVAGKDVNLSVDEVTLAQAPAALKSAKVQEKGDVIKELTVPVSAASTKGPIPGMTSAQAFTAIQKMADHSQKWHDSSSSWNIDSSSNTGGIAAIVRAHLDKECPLNEEVKSVEEVKPSLEELMSKHLEESIRRRAEMEEWVKKLQENAKTATEVPNLSVGQCKAVYANDGALIDNKSSNETNEVSFIANNKAQEAQEEDDVPTKVLPCQLPLKELNPRSFTLPCTIRSLNFYVMADLGASVNVIPRSMFEHIKLSNLNKTAMLVEMDDMTKRAPIGIVENVLVGIKSLLEVTAAKGCVTAAKHKLVLLVILMKNMLRLLVTTVSLVLLVKKLLLLVLKVNAAGDDIVVESEVAGKDVNLSVDEVTLAQAPAALKSAKVQEKGDVIKELTVPVSAASTKVSTVIPTTAATIITAVSSRPRAKGIVFHEQEQEQEQAPTPIVYSQQSTLRQEQG